MYSQGRILAGDGTLYLQSSSSIPELSSSVLLAKDDSPSWWICIAVEEANCDDTPLVVFVVP